MSALSESRHRALSRRRPGATGHGQFDGTGRLDYADFVPKALEFLGHQV